MSTVFTTSRWKMYVVVTVLTALIWVFAESESLRTSTVTVEVVFESGAEGLAVRPAPDDEGWSGRITIELGGTALGISRVRDELPGRLVLRAGRDFPAVPGRRLLDLRELIGSTQLLTNNTVTVEQCTPSGVTVEVEDLREVQVRVAVRLPAGSGRTTAVAEPATVLVRLPATAADRLEAEGIGIGVHVSVNEDQLAGITLGEQAEVRGLEVLPDIDLRMAGAWVAEIEPSAVAVQVTRRAITETVTMPSIPVFLRMTPLELNRWDVVVPPPGDALREVTFTGPAEAIERIRSRALVVTADVTLTYDELAGGITAKRARIHGLPEGVSYRVVSDEVSLRISPRETGG